MTRGAKPYLVPEAGVVLGPWTVAGAEGWEPLGDQVEGWDTGTDITIRREVSVDMRAVKGACGVPDTVPLFVTASWTSSSTLMSDVAVAVPLPPSGQVVLEAVLPGERVGGTLELRTTVAIAADWQAPAGVAGVAGAVLAEHTCKLALEGTGSLFPVSVVDFTHTGFDNDASWQLDSSVDLEAPFLGRFLLSINSRDTELVAAISAPARNARQEALVSALHHEVAQLMLRIAQDVNIDEPLQDVDWPAESVGDVLCRTLNASDLLHPTSATDPADLSLRRSQIEGSTRRAGHGRAFS